MTSSGAKSDKFIDARRAIIAVSMRTCRFLNENVTGFGVVDAISKFGKVSDSAVSGQLKSLFPKDTPHNPD